MLLLQTAYLTAIAVLVEKQSAVQANSQHEKWVCTAAGVSISHWGGLLLLRELHLLHSKAVIVAPISVENTHLHPSIHPHSSKSLGEAWVSFLCLLYSKAIMCIITYYLNGHN